MAQGSGDGSGTGQGRGYGKGSRAIRPGGNRGCAQGTKGSFQADRLVWHTIAVLVFNRYRELLGGIIGEDVDCRLWG